MTVLIEVYLLCLIELVSLRDIGKPTSRAEMNIPSSLYLKAVKGTHLGSALFVVSFVVWRLFCTFQAIEKLLGLPDFK